MDNINQPSNQKRLNGLKPIYAGGFRYEPILQNTSNDISTWASLAFTFLDDIAINNPASGSQVTSNINGFTVGTAFLANDVVSSNTNISSDSLSVNINSGIIFPINRTTAYDGEIRQIISGSVTLTLKVSPSGDFTTLFYNNFTGTGVPGWTVTGPYQNFWIDNSSNIDPLFGATNNVGAIRIEPGVTLQIANADNNYSTATYNNFTSGYPGNILFSGSAVNGLITTYYLNIPRIPLRGGSNGLDKVIITSNGTTASFSATSPQNTFQTTGPLVSYSQPLGNYNIEEDDGLIIQVTYPIEGLIILPAGVTNDNIPLKNLLGSIGNIAQTLTFTRTTSSSRIKFKTSPLTSIVRTLQGSNFYYTQAPNQIYITGSFDNGFNSGSALSNNWYFERGNKVVSGSLFTLLTASYDLSKLYYDHYIPGGNYYGNLIKQTLPSGTIDLGYQPITKFFNPKKGDLLRFFNHDSDTFPFASPFEREITNIYLPNQTIGTGSNGTGSYDGRLVFEVSEHTSPNNNLPPDILNQSCVNNPTGSAIGHVINFIMLSKIEDETNIVLLTSKNQGQTSPGILLPEYLTKETKEDAGNIVKRLKAQNLLDVSTTNITNV